MSLGGERLHVSGVDAVLGEPVVNVTQPAEILPFVTPVRATTYPIGDGDEDEDDEVGAILIGLGRIETEIRNLRIDLIARHESVWYRRLVRWLRATWSRVLSRARH